MSNGEPIPSDELGLSPEELSTLRKTDSIVNNEPQKTENPFFESNRKANKRNLDNQFKPLPGVRIVEPETPNDATQLNTNIFLNDISNSTQETEPIRLNQETQPRKILSQYSMPQEDFDNPDEDELAQTKPNPAINLSVDTRDRNTTLREQEFKTKTEDLTSGDNPEVSSEWLQDKARLYKHGMGRALEDLIETRREGNKMFGKYSTDDFATKEEWQRFKDDWVKFGPLINEEVRRLEPTTTHKDNPGINDRIAQALEESARYQEEQLEGQRQQLELMMRGYNGVILSVEERSAINPESFFQSVPPWFEKLSKQEKAMIKNMLHVNYLAATKRDNADGWLGEIKGLRIERDALENMKRYQPGFRNGFVTMLHDIFKQEGETFVISGTKGDRSKGIAPTEGYAILESETSLNAYKANKVAELTAFLSRNPDAINYSRNMRVSVKDIATVAISNADNLFFGTGAYDSADEIRGLSAGDANVCSEAVRIFYKPGQKGESKWLLDKRDKGTGQEDFGGVLGGWMRENALANRVGYLKSDETVLKKGFREELKDNDIELIPDRLFYSMMDHERFQDIPGLAYKDKTIAEVVLNAPKQEVARGIWDFIEGNDALDFSKLAATDIYGDYTDTRGGAIKIFKHITASKSEDMLDTNGVINALIKARKDPLVNKIFRNEDLMTACIIMTARPPGLLRGIPQMLLNVPENLYDFWAYNITNDIRLFDGMEPGFRTRFLMRINANDKSDTSAKNIVQNIGRGGMIDKRRILRDKANQNLNKTMA